MQEQIDINVLILAAGKGTRMKSARAKVLHEVFFKPMVHHVLDAVSLLDVDKTILVTGHQADEVEQSCAAYDTRFVRQHEQLGTGHAVLSAQSALQNGLGLVMILCGDTPLIRPETLKDMLAQHLSGAHFLTVMTTVLDDPTNYGRIISDDNGYVEAIVEEKDASSSQKEICEINAGIYCVNKDFLFTALADVDTDNAQGEVYLTDIVEMAHVAGQKVHKFTCSDAEEVLGVNSRVELSQAHYTLQKRLHQDLMGQGVTLNLPDTITINKTVSIGRDTVIHPNVYISGNTIIGENCTIAPFSYLVDCQLGDNVVIGAGSFLQGVTLSDNETVSPHTAIYK